MPSKTQESSSSTLSHCSRGVALISSKMGLAWKARSPPSITSSYSRFQSSPATGSPYSCSTSPTIFEASRQ
ncbi:MAG: hypothetical protein QM767_28545 [Anaeromyxobacter sp.]